MLGALLQLWNIANAQVNPAPAMDTVVDHAVLPLTQDQPWVGFSVGVVKDGQIYRFNYGRTAKDKDEVPSEHTLYELGSVTKTFTSIILANAVLEKKVSLDDDIRRYLKGDYPNLEYNGKPIRLLHLVNLTSSLPNNMPDISSLKRSDSIFYAVVKLNEHYGREDFFRDLHSVKLDTVPGLVPRHSNAAAELLGFILENVYQTSYEALVKKYITGPLKMEHTYLTVPADQSALLAKCYNEKGLTQPYIIPNAGAAGGMKSCMDDMVRYVSFQLDENNAAVKMTHQVAWGDVNTFALGLNWFMGTFDGKRQVRMDGTTFGFTSYCLLYPDLHFGVFLMTNECASNSTIQDKLAGIAKNIFEENYYTAAERSSDGFGFSPSINLLVSELNKRGFDHASDVAAELAKSRPTFKLDENETNIWAYALMRKGKKVEALEIFKLNTGLHPDSWNAYDSEAEGYENVGDTNNAIKFYNRSLELNPQNTNAVEQLKRLKAN